MNRTYVEQIDEILDALAADSGVSHPEYVDALDDLHFRIGAALDAARREVTG